mmetsp:Transcript_38230/g.85165  ORF Transcript_38230/g.85165 Transcript_38230/m.85165 type:complete len:205 (-) Transcript_38230:1497-2111(-)
MVVCTEGPAAPAADPPCLPRAFSLPTPPSTPTLVPSLTTLLTALRPALTDLLPLALLVLTLSVSAVAGLAGRPRVVPAALPALEEAPVRSLDLLRVDLTSVLSCSALAIALAASAPARAAHIAAAFLPAGVLACCGPEYTSLYLDADVSSPRLATGGSADMEGRGALLAATSAGTAAAEETVCPALEAASKIVGNKLADAACLA